MTLRRRLGRLEALTRPHVHDEADEAQALARVRETVARLRQWAAAGSRPAAKCVALIDRITAGEHAADLTEGRTP